jgi:16S rRNA (uracil1498-N3)-methyltransferase
MRRFFVPPGKIANQRAVLEDSDAHHLRSVLRLRPGDSIVLYDGTGTEYQARIRTIDSKRVQVDLLSQTAGATESKVEVAVAQGFLKEKKMDELIRPLTELGVNRWIPFMAHRSVPVPDPKRLTARHARWQKIALESLKQCRRSQSMGIAEPVHFEAAIELADPYPLKLLFWENESVLLDHSLARMPQNRVFIMIGPEGGFEIEELEKARARGFKSIGLGPRILRAETATLTAAALVQFLWGDLGPRI